MNGDKAKKKKKSDDPQTPTDTIVALGFRRWAGSARQSFASAAGGSLACHAVSSTLLTPANETYAAARPGPATDLSPPFLPISISPQPGTYTEKTLRNCTRSLPPLLDALIAALLNGGARAAQSGRFTLRRSCTARRTWRRPKRSSA